MRNIYTAELDAITHRVLKMGTTLEQSIDKTIQVLTDIDAAGAQRLIDDDDIFDQMERSIEQHCLNLVARQAPVASDWRRIASVMRMISDLERIADHCSDIAEYVLKLAERPSVPQPAGLSAMLARVKDMLRTTVTGPWPERTSNSSMRRSAYLRTSPLLMKPMCSNGGSRKRWSTMFCSSVKSRMRPCL